MKSNNVENIDSIKNEYENKLLLIKQRLLSELDEVESALKDLYKFKSNSKQSISNGKKTSITQHDLQELSEASGSEIFLWAFDKIGKNEVTVAEIADYIEDLDIDKVQNRDMTELRQWLTVSANSLCKSSVLYKDNRKDRKGGIVFKKA